MSPYWSWALTTIGVTAFYLTSRKVWWGWWINVGGQVVWLAYAIITVQFGFVVAALLYAWVFWRNAMLATRTHRSVDIEEMEKFHKAQEALKHHPGGIR